MSSICTVNPRYSGNKAISRFFALGRRAACKSRSMAGAVASPEQLLKVYDYDALSESDTKELIQRPRIDFSAILDTVRCPSALNRVIGVRTACQPSHQLAKQGKPAL